MTPETGAEEEEKLASELLVMHGARNLPTDVNTSDSLQYMHSHTINGGTPIAG